jgi:hypothetical protein
MTVMAVTGSPGQAKAPTRWGRAARVCTVIVALIVILAVAAATAAFVVSRSREGVINGSASHDLTGWSARSDAGRIGMTRSHLDGPHNITTAVDLQRVGDGRGSWARAMIRLRHPTTFLKVGKSYRLRLYVRNATSTRQTLGLLLADENYAHRPSDVSKYVTFADAAWHEVGLTFTCTTPPASNTGVYVALPVSGAFNWQVTGASLRRAQLPQPARVHGAPAPESVKSIETVAVSSFAVRLPAG